MPKDASDKAGKVVVLLILLPFTILGHWIGLICQALIHSISKGRGEAMALLDEVDQARRIQRERHLTQNRFR